MANHEREHLNHSGKHNQFLPGNEVVRKYIDLFDRLPIGIYRSTPDGKILAANPSFINLLGYTNFDDIEGIDLNKTHKSPEDRIRFIKEIEEKGEIYAKESVLVHSDGHEIVVEEYARSYRNDDGSTQFYEGIVIDITQKLNDRERIAFLNSFKELIFNLTTSFINIRLSDIDDQIVYSLRSIGNFIGADRSYVFLFDDTDMKRMSNTHEALADGIDSVIDELQDLNTGDYPWWMDNLRKNKAIIIPDVSDLPVEAHNEKEIFTRQRILSLFAVPMFFDYQLIGFLGFDMVRTHKVVEDDALELLEIAASLFANILNYQKSEISLREMCKKREGLIDVKTCELQKANEQLRVIAESSNDVIWTMDLNLKINFISPSVFKHLGFTPEEFTSLPLEKLIPSESYKIITEVLERELELVKTGKEKADQHSFVFEMLHYTKNGENLWSEVNFNFLFDNNGNPFGIYGISRNIHDRKMAEMALWESNERFRALVENTTDWIWEIDENICISYTSPNSEKITGYCEDELNGTSFPQMLAAESAESTKNFFLNAMDAAKPFHNLETTSIHKNGKKIFFETSGAPILNMDGYLVGFRGITRDITEKKRIESALRQSQQKLSQHLRNTPMGYIEWDSNLEVIEWNPSAQRIFGYSKAEAMVGNMIKKLVPEDLFDEVLEVFPTVVKGKQAVHKINKCITRDGRTIVCEWFNTPLTDETGEVIGLASLVREIPNSNQGI